MKHLPKVGALLCISVMFSSGHALCGGKNQPTKIKAGAIQVAMIESDEASVPAEFRVALYENLIGQLKKHGFQSVYREGDRNAASVTDLVVLHSTVRRFKHGSEEARQVTTVVGATSISVHC